MIGKEVEFEGHLIDSLILSKALDTILDLEGEFEILEFRVGRKKEEHSYARLFVAGKDEEHLNKILRELHKLGAREIKPEEVELKEAEADKVLPDNFYVTTNHPTYVFYKGRWIEVEDISMDRVIAIRDDRAVCISIDEVKKGDKIVVGEKGVKVVPPERPRKYSPFQFMGGSVSSERPTEEITEIIAREMIELKKKGGRIAVVAGPAVNHTGAREALAAMIRDGYVDLLLSGNALAVHDIEASLFGTSLGMDLRTGRPVPGGNRHHLYTISKIISVGGIKRAVELGIVKDGIMYECVKNNVPFILAGSIRDDGPLPEVITDVMKAKKAMKEALRGIDMVLMLATTLHSIAVGNLLPSTVKTICVDINPATVTKLMDRGTAQAIGVVTDVGLFLPKLYEKLRELRE
ncbi:LOR/SDH bifunctional protein conserved domain protein [Ferroglobus placidus DSM 10642]|uniref:Ornithine cyclodeaminase n=1 Tax=Ferroglobus placidus (strain DSM 10642 / AEDII12DO) TaxID=589924 RepID=D3S0W9_FERPA|nr:TIGR00300 family protein [Ferroglobus placidus]ADC66360.1 LOR/SDH bifunctional protein conserved domain protein [Ferroglobus placidus DSM 10642]